MKKRLTGSLLALFVTASLVAGCGRDGTDPAKSNAENSKQPIVEEVKPATIKILKGNISDEVFQLMVADPLAKKYPQITLVVQSGKLSDLIAAGETPDLITDWNGGVPSYQQFDVLMDMNELIKRNKFDLNRFQSVYIDAIRKFSEKGEVFAIPYYAQLSALYYNKDLFDQMGVGYPKDGLTWDETIDLTARVTRQIAGVQIKGLNYNGVQRLAFPFSPDIVSAKTGKATVNSDIWKRALEYCLRIDSIPGNRPNQDFNKGLVAMYAGLGDAMAGIKKAVESNVISIGVAQYPQFKEAPNTYSMVDAHYIFVTKTSKNQDAAMKVIEVMTSDEAQMATAKTFARLSPLKDPELQKQFGKDFLPGVDLQSIFKSKPAPGPEFSKYYPQSRDIIVNEYSQVADGKKDINTALRDAEERINKFVADEMAKTGGK